MISNFDRPVTCTNSCRPKRDSVATQSDAELGHNAVGSSDRTAADSFDSSLLSLESIRSKLAKFNVNSEDFDRYLSSFLGRAEQEQTEQRDQIGSENLARPDPVTGDQPATFPKCEPVQNEADANSADPIEIASASGVEMAPSESEGDDQSTSMSTSQLIDAAFCLEETDSIRATICTEPTRRVQAKERHRFHRWREKADHRVSALLNRITIKTDFEIKRSRRAGERSTLISRS